MKASQKERIGQYLLSGRSNDMKITNITKEYYEVDGEKVYFLEPLEKVISIKELQKIMDTAEELVNKLREGK
jgi:hypothetical protein